MDTNGGYRSIDEIDRLGVPIPTHFGHLKAGEDPVAAYGRIREKLQATIQSQDDEKSLYPDFEVWGCINLTMILDFRSAFYMRLLDVIDVRQRYSKIFLPPRHKVK